MSIFTIITALTALFLLAHLIIELRKDHQDTYYIVFIAVAFLLFSIATIGTIMLK